MIVEWSFAMLALKRRRADNKPPCSLPRLAISPTLIAGFSLVEAVVPPSRLTEGFAWISTALNIGVSAGAAVSGRIVDGYGASPAYLVAIAFGACAAAACVLGAFVDRRRPDRAREGTPR